MENYNQGNSDIFSLELDAQGKSTLLEMSRWTKFLAILGFIFLGLMVIGGLFVGMAMSAISSSLGSQFGALASIGGAGIAVLYILIAALCFYPVYALLKYSTGMKSALASSNKEKFNQALNYLKNMFKYIGIIYIILLGLYGIVILIGVIAAASR